MHNRPLKTLLPGVPLSGSRRRRASGAEAAWRTVRAIAGVFLLIVGLVMIWGHIGGSAIEPLKSPELAALKEKLRLNPADEQIKQQIRQVDFQVRGGYFRQLSLSSSGVRLLLAGVVVFILASTQAARYGKQLPMPHPKTSPSDTAAIAKLARWSVGAAGAAVATVLLLTSFGPSAAIPEPGHGDLAQSVSHAGTGSLPADAASDDELRRNWPRFRGFGGSGVSEATNLPVSWDAKTGASIAWKTPVPAAGFNSPIIWGDKFFFSGGDSSKREVFCYDSGTGQMIWRQALTNVPGAPGQAPEIPETTGYAASSMATDGRRVYVIFATGDVGAFTMDGKQVWAKSFGPLKNPYGHATSLLTWHDRLIVLLDQGEGEEGKSKLYALDGRTGKVVWQTARKVGSSWATPVSAEAAGQWQVIALSIPWAISYRLTDGGELWRVECLSGEVTPSPVFAGGFVLVPSPSEKLLAIGPDGRGDVTKTHVAWSTEENVPDVTSPVSNSDLVFTLTTPGLLTCLSGKDGKKLWEHDYEFECHASPSIAQNRVYFFGQKGTAVITEAGPQFKELFRTDMPDVFHASPAFAPDRIILRGTTNLWGLGSAPGKERATVK